jgi:hypothetical protein
MSCISFISISDFQYGAELTISVAEDRNGPYIESIKNDYDIK